VPYTTLFRSDLGYIAATLNNHTDIALSLVRLFKTRFYLARKLSAEALAEKQERLVEAIRGALDGVTVLNEDRILRRFLEAILATVRSNFYQTDRSEERRVGEECRARGTAYH